MVSFPSLEGVTISFLNFTFSGLQMRNVEYVMPRFHYKNVPRVPCENGQENVGCNTPIPGGMGSKPRKCLPKFAAAHSR